MWFLGHLLVLLATAVAFCLTYFKWQYQYWERKKLNHLKAKFPWGTAGNIFTRKTHVGVKFKQLYQEMKSSQWKHGGIYLLGKPAYVPIDLEYVKNVMSKDFQYFTDRGFYYNEKGDPLSAHLFSVGGVKWRRLRTKLTPTFTSGKMKLMFQTLVDCEENLQEAMRKYQENQEINIKEVLGCFTTDIIGSVAFGLDCQTFKEDDSPFRVFGKKAFSLPTLDIPKVILANNFEALGRFLNISVNRKDVSKFFTKVVEDTIEYREKNNISRKDFMQLLIEMKNEEDGLSFEEIAAQAFVFFLAGFETSSTTMAFALYELAGNPEIQERVRTEIGDVLGKDGKITYEAIHELKYMQQVIDETLRKYPPLPFLSRKCVKDYKVPGEDLTIVKGTSVNIPILGIHYDPELYPEPDKFDPGRFSDENKKHRHQFAHIPFGEGPRLCIGMRFGLMQTKVGLTSLLRNYRFSVNEKTKEPLDFQPNVFVLAAQGEIWLNAEKI